MSKDRYARCQHCTAVIVQTADGWEVIDSHSRRPTGVYSKPDPVTGVSHPHRPVTTPDGEIIWCSKMGKPL